MTCAVFFDTPNVAYRLMENYEWYRRALRMVLTDILLDVLQGEQNLEVLLVIPFAQEGTRHHHELLARTVRHICDELSETLSRPSSLKEQFSQDVREILAYFSSVIAARLFSVLKGRLKSKLERIRLLIKDSLNVPQDLVSKLCEQYQENVARYVIAPLILLQRSFDAIYFVTFDREALSSIDVVTTYGDMCGIRYCKVPELLKLALSVMRRC